MNTRETLTETIDYSLIQLAGGEAALLSAQTSQGKYTEAVGLLADRVNDTLAIALHAADLATRVNVYTESGNGKVTAAKNTLLTAAVGTENPLLQCALSDTVIAHNELEGRAQEAALGCIDHAGLRLQTVRNLLSSLTREVTALQQEADTTSMHIADAASATQSAKRAGEEYLDVLYGRPL